MKRLTRCLLRGKQNYLKVTSEVKIIQLFLFSGDEPTKIDSDVFAAIGDDFDLDESKYPFVFKWHRAMKALGSKSMPIKNNFRLFTPKLKIHG